MHVCTSDRSQQIKQISDKNNIVASVGTDKSLVTLLADADADAAAFVYVSRAWCCVVSFA